MATEFDGGSTWPHAASSSSNGNDSCSVANADIAQLLASVQGWLGNLIHSTGASAALGDQGAAQHDRSTCSWCPLCRVVAMLESQRPELMTQIDAARSAVNILVQTLLTALLADGAKFDAPDSDS